MNEIINELKRRKENMEQQVSILRVDSLFGSPSKICDTKEQLFKAENELETINNALSNIPKKESESNKTSRNEYENLRENNVRLGKEHDAKNSEYKSKQTIKESGIQKIGIEVVIGVLILMVAYIFRTHLGISL